MLHPKLVRYVRGAPLAYMVQCHVKVGHISPGYGTYLNLDEEMISKAPIVDSKWNLKINKEPLSRVYFDYQ